MTSGSLISTIWWTIMSNSFDWLTRLFCFFPNHDTTLTVILKLVFFRTERTVHTGKNQGKNLTRRKLNLINFRLLVYFLCLSIFESDIVLLFSVLTVAKNRNSSNHHVSKLNVFFFLYRLSLWKDCTAGSFYYSLCMSELLNRNIKHVKSVLTHYRRV